MEHFFINRVVFSKRKNGITHIWDDGIEVFHIGQKGDGDTTAWIYWDSNRI